jgi:adenylate cyclase
MDNRTRLPLYTFLAVFVAILVVGALIMPLVLDVLQTNYYRLQTDVNERQARSMAQFIQNRIDSGAPEDQVLTEFQAAISGQQFDRGYVCIVDQESTNYLCHPMIQALGMSVTLKQALYDDDYDGQDLVKWENSIQAGESGGGLLQYQSDGASEVVFFQSIEEKGWTVSSHENTARLDAEFARIRTFTIAGSGILAFLLAFPISFAARRVSRRYERRIEAEQAKSDNLLLNILPAPIAERMKQDEKTIVDQFDEVSILFADIVDFTPLSATKTPAELVDLLNRVFSEFDHLCERYGVEKIKTIGDGYMAVSGVPRPDKRHAHKLAHLALDMLEAVKKVDESLEIRIGLHTGSVVAGVIGERKFIYDLWGDAVNLASRLESQGKRGKIHVSVEYAQKIKEKFFFVDNGVNEIKGKGKMHTYFLSREK